MVNKPEVLAIIPARGGSKGIPRKNIRLFAGYPLIAYSIEAGLRAESVTRVILSTDDEEIASVAREYGAETPFLRPAEFARDDSTDLPVFTQALDWLKMHEGYEPEIMVQLRPTSPFRPMDCVDNAVRKLIDHPEADSVRGVVSAGQNPHKMWILDGDQKPMHPLLKVPGLAEPYNAPRQALPPVHWQTGHIDAIRVSTIYQKKSLSGEVILPLVLDGRYTIDIDTPFDWKRYEYLVLNSSLDFVDPAKMRRAIPEKVSLLVMDFDGVLTDNRVWVDEGGRERVAGNRSDSLGLSILRQKTSVHSVVISQETNPVVTARCKKMNVEVYQGIMDKASLLKQILTERGIDPGEAIYMGNDVNDLPCLPLVSCFIAPADAQPAGLRADDRVLGFKGGHGAVRELCDILMENESNQVK
ncbi:MAG: acylneuraminate cytidylyltransferase [Anaerolineaceae bacterium]|nr:acylneuraminate cytidylyltransferase [Anaerolineaceae bacterium]